MKHYQKANFLPTVSVAVVVVIAIALAFSSVFADAGRRGDVNGNAVVDNREDTRNADKDKTEDTDTGTDEEVDGLEGDDSEEKITDEGESQGEEIKESWYKKYWWVLLCPTTLVFFGAGVGVYYLVSLFKRKK